MNVWMAYARKLEKEVDQWERGRWESERSQNIRHDRDRLREALERIALEYDARATTRIGEIVAAALNIQEDSYHDRRVKRRLADPEYRAEYERARQALRGEQDG